MTESIIEVAGEVRPQAHAGGSEGPISAGSSAIGPSSASDSPGADPVDVALERALEGLFRLGANRRFDQHQAIAVGAIVTRAGYAVLRSLHDHEALSVRDLAEACAMDPATVSRQIQPLVEQGLVERRADADDARRVALRLTPHGRAVYARIVDYRLAWTSGVVADWSQEDRARLAELVSRLVDDLRRPLREELEGPD